MTRPEPAPETSGTDAAVPPTPPTEPRPEPPAPAEGAEPDMSGAATTDLAVPAPGSEDTLGSTVAALVEEDLEPRRRRRLLGRLVHEARGRGIGSVFKPGAAIRWVADVVTDAAPHIPIRDLDTLRRHHDGLDGEELAERLVRIAARATAGVGAAGGGIAAVEWVVTPTLLTAPVLLAAETVAVVAIEMKLIGELHEVYRSPVPGTGAQRAVALIRSWANQRGVNPMVPGTGFGAVLGTAARRELRERLLRRFSRNITSLGPLMTGAAVAGYLNRRATLGLAERVRADLRGADRQRPALPPA